MSVIEMFREGGNEGGRDDFGYRDVSSSNSNYCSEFMTDPKTNHDQSNGRIEKVVGKLHFY